MRNSAFLVAYGLKIADEAVLARIVRSAFKGRPAGEMRSAASRYAEEVMPLHIKSSVFNSLKRHQRQGHRCIIVSRSLSLYLDPWADKAGVSEVYATELEEKNGILTGGMVGKSCSGEEKARRLKAALPNRADYFIVSYADSPSDLPLMDLADQKEWIT